MKTEETFSQKKHSPTTLKGKRILVVDDLVDNRTLECLFLRKVGAEVETAINGKDAVEKAMKGHHDAIVMDLHMPVLDGIEAATQLREKGYTKPMIAVTADCYHEIRNRALSVGFDDYLLKPLGARQLIHALDCIFKGSFKLLCSQS